MKSFLAIMDGRARDNIDVAIVIECICEDETIEHYTEEAKRTIRTGIYGDAVLVGFDEQQAPDGTELVNGRVIWDTAWEEGK